jgi:hypothetical protein
VSKTSLCMRCSRGRGEFFFLLLLLLLIYIYIYIFINILSPNYLVINLLSLFSLISLKSGTFLIFCKCLIFVASRLVWPCCPILLAGHFSCEKKEILFLLLQKSHRGRATNIRAEIHKSQVDKAPPGLLHCAYIYQFFKCKTMN